MHILVCICINTIFTYIYNIYIYILRETWAMPMGIEPWVRLKLPLCQRFLLFDSAQRYLKSPVLRPRRRISDKEPALILPRVQYP